MERMPNRTHYRRRRSSPRLQVLSLPEDACVELLEYNKLPDAEEAQLRLFQAHISHESTLRDEIGVEAASMFVDVGRSSRVEAAGRGNVLGIARQAAGMNASDSAVYDIL